MANSPRTARKIAMITLGCPKNEVDSDVLAGQLVAGGVEVVEDARSADIILVNTCGFIEAAKRESIDAILEAVALKENDADKKRVYVWGCLSERYRDDIQKEIPEADGYFGVEPFQELCREILNTQYEWCDTAYTSRFIPTPSHTAYLKIADGCDHGCTFCAIPLIKGAYRSRSLESVEDEARALAKRGVKELILVSQDTTAFGSDIGDETHLAALLKRLTRIDGVRWIRWMYGHPSHLKDDVVDLMAGEEKICRYVDLPLQHISDPLLKVMGRGATRRSVEDLIDKLRDRIPGLVLRTAFIVGFPGETDEMFQELLDFVETVRFERMGAFLYSPEEGTAAFHAKNKVPKHMAEERYRILMETQQEISTEINQTLVDRTVPVIVDGYDEEQGVCFGRTEGDAPDIDQTVWIRGESPVGEIISVKIEAASAYDLEGAPVSSLEGKGGW